MQVQVRNFPERHASVVEGTTVLKPRDLIPCVCDLTSVLRFTIYGEELGPFHQELSALSPEERGHYHYPGLNIQAESQQTHHQWGSFVSNT